MLKPLELRTFNINDRVTGWVISSDSPPISTWQEIPAELAKAVARGKRLTTTELAAELWRSTADEWQANEWGDAQLTQEGSTWTGDLIATRRRSEVLIRFATMPHYDEEVTP